MNKIFRIALLIGLVSLAYMGCRTEKEATTSNKSKEPVLLNFPGHAEVTKGAFEYIYQKNNGGWDDAKGHSMDQYQEYLDLYINFKRKVIEADKLGLGDTKEFKTEFEGYRKQLAQPYLVDKDAQEELIREAYERSKTLINASHLLIKCGPDAKPEDSLKAYNKVMKYRRRILEEGKDFAEVAAEKSDDPSAKQNGGNLGFFSVFDMVYPFESGAFKTAKGDVSMPIRSSYGYHLIKVHDKITNDGKQSAAHIIIRVGPQYSAKNDDQASAKINEIYQKLKNGEDFAELAMAYSDDPTTSKRGGDLGNGRLIPEMENIKRKLKENDLSEPFTTSFGWHILKVTKVDPVKPFDEAKPELKSRIARDSRSTLSREKLVAKVKSEYGYRLNAVNLDMFMKSIDSKAEPAYIKGFWRPVDSLHGPMSELDLYSIGSGDKKFTGTLDDYFEWYLKSRKGYEGADVSTATRKNMETFIEAEMLKYEESQLPLKYPEYRELLKEYRDGILLFTLTEDKVWRKAVEDTSGLKAYYEEHRTEFTADERVEVIEYISESKTIVEQVQRLLEKKHDQNYIDSVINQKSALNVRIRTQSYEKGKAEKEAELFGKEPGHRTSVQNYGKAFRILVVKENLPAGIKSFKDAKSECITQYQNYLEETWLKELEEKYPVKVNDNVLGKLFK